jgi:hypothetical protein
MQLNNDHVHLNCTNCGKKDKIHINRVDASIDNRLIILGIVIGAICTVFLWEFGFIAAVTFLVPIFFWNQEMKLSSQFNKTLIPREK